MIASIASHRFRTLVLPAAVALFGPSSVHAQHAANPPLKQLVQELFVAETVQPQGRGELQLTAAGSADRPLDGGRWPARAQGLAEYGLTDRWQLSVRTPAAGPDRDPDDRRVVPRLFVAVLPGSHPFALSVFAESGVARGVAASSAYGAIAARGFGRLQLHGMETLERSEGEVQSSETLAALWDAGAWTPTLELAHQGEHVARWALVPGLYGHIGDTFEAGVGIPLSLVGGPTITGARLVLTLELGGD